MFSEMFNDLWSHGIILKGIWETIYMTLLSTGIAYVIGLPLGVILNVTSPNGLSPNRIINKVLGFIINFMRSIPFIILMVAFLPVAKAIVGNKAMIVMLVVAAFPYIARMVESSLKEVDYGKIEAARSMGASDFKIIYKVIIPEARPALINGAIISAITILGYSAMASTIGGTGLGQIAIIYGHQRSNPDITWVCVFLMVLIVVIIQEVGIIIVKKTDKRRRVNG